MAAMVNCKSDDSGSILLLRRSVFEACAEIWTPQGRVGARGATALEKIFAVPEIVGWMMCYLYASICLLNGAHYENE